MPEFHAVSVKSMDPRLSIYWTVYGYLAIIQVSHGQVFCGASRMDAFWRAHNFKFWKSAGMSEAIKKVQERRQPIRNVNITDITMN
ncbi:hypothetical protein NX783_20010, partial [Massilia kyonggiensis]|nr:hypothetical protein [Massilia kyonggiensis]